LEVSHLHWRGGRLRSERVITTEDDYSDNRRGVAAHETFSGRKRTRDRAWHWDDFVALRRPTSTSRN
jgi:hypothetical protein